MEMNIRADALARRALSNGRSFAVTVNFTVHREIRSCEIRSSTTVN